MVKPRPTLQLVRGGLPPEAAAASQTVDPNAEDQALLDAVRAGRPGIATAVHDRLQPTVARTVARLLGRSDSDFADLTQQALIEIVLNVDRFRGEGSLDGWASVTTAHVVWKHLRRRRLERRLFEELVPDAAVSGGSPAREVQWRQTAELLKAHLEGMNADRASAFVLHDVWGYDLREMAEILGVSVAAAQTRLSRGRRELEGRIAKDPHLANVFVDGAQPKNEGEAGT